MNEENGNSENMVKIFVPRIIRSFETCIVRAINTREYRVDNNRIREANLLKIFRRNFIISIFKIRVSLARLASGIGAGDRKSDLMR